MIIKIIGLVVVVVFVASLQISGMIRKQMKKEMIVYGIVTGLGLVLAIMQIAELRIPNPVEGLRIIYSPVSHWFVPPSME